MAMPRLRRLMIVPVALLGALLAPAGALADASPDPSGFRLESSALTVNESAGQAVITIERTDTSEDAQIRYITLGDGVPCGPAECTAVDPIDFTSVKGMLDFPVGVSSETFTVPIVDHGVQSAPKTMQVSLFGPSPIGMASPSKAVLTIVNNDPSPARDPQNPLALPAAPTGTNPLAGANFFVDPESEAAHAARQNPALDVIAREPGTARFGSFSFGSNGVPDIQTAVSRYLSRAQVEAPGTVPLLATYRIVDGHCGHWADPAADQAAYHNFIEGFASGIGSYRAVLFLEMDSIITMPCLSPHGKAVREHELQDAINVLTANCPHLVIYLDAGASDALPARRRRGTCGLRSRQGPGVLPERHPFRLDHARDPVWRPDLPPHRRQALRGQHRRERPRSTAPAGHRARRPRGPVQPARPGPRTAAHRQYRLPQRRHVRVDQQPRRVRRQLRSGRTADRRLLAGVRGDARAQRQLQRALSGRASVSAPRRFATPNVHSS